MSKRFLLFGVGAAIFMLLVVGSFSVGMFVGGVFADEETPTTSTVLQSTVESVLSTTVPGSVATPANTEELFEPFWQSWDLVHDIYIDQPVDDEALMQGAIRGLMDSLGDQHISSSEPPSPRRI
jgi:carboxyl-terminal processing protease